jgi:hypothetical protein
VGVVAAVNGPLENRHPYRAGLSPSQFYGSK